MKKEQIIMAKIRIEKMISKREGILERARRLTTKAENKLADAEEKLWKLRSKCQHEYSNEKNPTVMGRGICEICGTSDY